MTVEFKTEKGWFTLIKVEPIESDRWFAIKRDIFEPYPSQKMQSYVVQMEDFGDTTREVGGSEIKLDENKYEILGLTSELTEEDWKGVISCMDYAGTTYGVEVANCQGYPKFDDGKEDDGTYVSLTQSIRESANSLLSSLKVFEKNPYGEKEPMEDDFDTFPLPICFDPMEEQKQLYGRSLRVDKKRGEWREANERTGSWLLLKKIN